MIVADSSIAPAVGSAGVVRKETVSPVLRATPVAEMVSLPPPPGGDRLASLRDAVDQHVDGLRAVGFVDRLDPDSDDVADQVGFRSPSRDERIRGVSKVSPSIRSE